MRWILSVSAAFALAGFVLASGARADSDAAPHDSERGSVLSSRRTTARATDAEMEPLPPIRLVKLDPNIEAAGRDLRQADESFDPFYPYQDDAGTGPMVISAECQTAFQAASVVGTRIVDDSFSITDIDVFGTWAFPLTEKMPLILTPGFGVHYFSTGDAPGTPTLPDQVYDFYLDVRFLYRHSERWTLDLAITPGWYSDLENGSSDALRIGARALSIVTWSPTLKLVGGIVYLDREDYPFVPGAGVLWNPSDDIEVMAAFPKPKAAYRFDATPEWSRWVYLAGEFGGGAWAINTPTTKDVMSYSDLRFIVGMEQRAFAGPTLRVEAGYVFARKVEFSDGSPDFDPDNAFMIRGALAF